MAEFRDRIKELRRVPARDLVINEKNWREHNTRQKDAMLELLSDIGYADALVAYELPNGRLKLLNGHMRRDLTPESIVPVLVLDVGEDEADKILATFDPISMMATTNRDNLKKLLDKLQINNYDMQSALRTMAADADKQRAATDPAARAESGGDEIPEMELEPLEHYDYVCVIARSVQDWNRIADVLCLDRQRKPGTRNVGMCRVVDAKKLLALIDKMQVTQAPQKPQKKGASDAA
jgi:hypothetical protein